ncbi:MnhB domain-containing protein [Aquibium sp. ELW1220]|uniref:MnhB domain-containing protein n=1 Tax=Aquibium sp. ELW1220 TaxID=2976766 RepID=UPI0025AF1985|nr:MnhB domain-containing protein [Aquibium sp. ELW1220]MDN2579139.1 Na(+)/H(+) antiporter subunit B [Aquibium sp. ELW1220]
MQIIFATMSRLFFVLMIGVSLFMLFRGHNEPGGGFIGGLIAALGFALLAMARGVETARRALVVHPVALMGSGLLLAFVSGLPGLLSDRSFLTHWWTEIGSTHLGTATTFDIGVYCVVVGGVLCLVFRLYEGIEQ